MLPPVTALPSPLVVTVVTFELSPLSTALIRLLTSLGVNVEKGNWLNVDSPSPNLSLAVLFTVSYSIAGSPFLILL